jgi:hypothetical protein
LCSPERHQQQAVEKDQRQQLAAQPVERRAFHPLDRRARRLLRRNMHQLRERALRQRKALLHAAHNQRGNDGQRQRNAQPQRGSLAGRESISTLPPIFSTLVRTTSMPTPRPLTLVTAAAVEKPGRKISCSSSRSPSCAARSA